MASYNNVGDMWDDMFGWEVSNQEPMPDVLRNMSQRRYRDCAENRPYNSPAYKVSRQHLANNASGKYKTAFAYTSNHAIPSPAYAPDRYNAGSNITSKHENVICRSDKVSCYYSQPPPQPNRYRSPLPQYIGGVPRVQRSHRQNYDYRSKRSLHRQNTRYRDEDSTYTRQDPYYKQSLKESRAMTTSATRSSSYKTVSATHIQTSKTTLKRRHQDGNEEAKRRKRMNDRHVALLSSSSSSSSSSYSLLSSSSLFDDDDEDNNHAWSNKGRYDDDTKCRSSSRSDACIPKDSSTLDKEQEERGNGIMREHCVEIREDKANENFHLENKDKTRRDYDTGISKKTYAHTFNKNLTLKQRKVDEELCRSRNCDDLENEISQTRKGKRKLYNLTMLSSSSSDSYCEKSRGLSSGRKVKVKLSLSRGQGRKLSASVRGQQRTESGEGDLPIGTKGKHQSQRCRRTVDVESPTKPRGRGESPTMAGDLTSHAVSGKNSDRPSSSVSNMMATPPQPAYLQNTDKMINWEKNKKTAHGSIQRSVRPRTEITTQEHSGKHARQSDKMTPKKRTPKNTSPAGFERTRTVPAVCKFPYENRHSADESTSCFTSSLCANRNVENQMFPYIKQTQQTDSCSLNGFTQKNQCLPGHYTLDHTNGIDTISFQNMDNLCKTMFMSPWSDSNHCLPTGMKPRGRGDLPTMAGDLTSHVISSNNSDTLSLGVSNILAPSPQPAYLQNTDKMKNGVKNKKMSHVSFLSNVRPGTETPTQEHRGKHARQSDEMTPKEQVNQGGQIALHQEKTADKTKATKVTATPKECERVEAKPEVTTYIVDCKAGTSNWDLDTSAAGFEPPSRSCTVPAVCDFLDTNRASADESTSYFMSSSCAERNVEKKTCLDIAYINQIQHTNHCSSNGFTPKDQCLPGQFTLDYTNGIQMTSFQNMDNLWKTMFTNPWSDPNHCLPTGMKPRSRGELPTMAGDLTNPTVSGKNSDILSSGVSNMMAPPPQPAYLQNTDKMKNWLKNKKTAH